MKRRNLIVVRAGDTSLHPTWLKGRGRTFDLLVSYYGEQPGRYRHDADIYHAMAGPRWPAHCAILAELGDVIADYEYVCFACDDLQADVGVWNRLFAACRRYRLDLAQPAVEGFVSYPIVSPHDGCVLRYTNFVEVMCPVFSRMTLARLAPTFAESVSGWGLSLLWWRRLKEAGRLAVIDEVRVRHGRPVGNGTLYQVLAERGVNPASELAALRDKYGGDYVPLETGRVLPPTAPLKRFLGRLRWV